MNILGIKLGGAGKVDKDRPYKGYKIVYGSKTLASLLASDCIPLTALVKYSGLMMGSNASPNSYCHFDVRATINGSAKTYRCHSINAWTATARVTVSGQVYLDLITAFGNNDFTSLMKLTSLDVTINAHSSNGGTLPETKSISITSWLEPISSGGGVAYKLLSLIHRIIRKDGGKR